MWLTKYEQKSKNRATWGTGEVTEVWVHGDIPWQTFQEAEEFAERLRLRPASVIRNVRVSVQP